MHVMLIFDIAIDTEFNMPSSSQQRDQTHCCDLLPASAVDPYQCGTCLSVWEWNDKDGWGLVVDTGPQGIAYAQDFAQSLRELGGKKIDGSRMDDSSPATFEEMVDRVFAQARAIMISRQRKYGAFNISRHGLLGVAVRLGDKLSRLDNLVLNGSGAEVADESVEDTLLDICNYGLIGVCVMRNWWGPSGCPPLSES